MPGNFMNVIVVGDPRVGKTNIIKRYFKNTFTDKYELTIDDEYYNKFIYIDDKRYLFRLWDRTGDKQFYSDSQNIIFKGCNCLFLVYDISSKESLEHIPDFIEKYKKLCPKEVLMVLVGNKCDLEKERKVSTEEGQKFAKENGMLFFETSAKTGDNVEELFQESINEIHKIIKNKEKENGKNDFSESKSERKKKEKNSCCFRDFIECI